MIYANSPSFTGIFWMKNKFLISPIVCSISQLHVNEYFSLRYHYNINPISSGKVIRRRGLSDDPVPNSLSYCDMNCMADSKENFLRDFGSERFKRNGVQVNQMVHEANISKFHIDSRTPLQPPSSHFPRLEFFKSDIFSPLALNHSTLLNVTMCCTLKTIFVSTISIQTA